jgi:replication factor A1
MASAEAPGLPVETRLRDLRVTEVPIAITARVVRVERREIRRRSDGGRRPVLAGLLSDGTATVRFTWWDPPNEDIDRGTVIRAAPVQVREYAGRPELSFGWKTRVAPAHAAELPTLRPEEVPQRRIADLGPRSEEFLLEARVSEVQPKNVTVGTERREIHQGLLTDSTGLLSFTSWTDLRLKVGEPIRVRGAYLRTFRGRPQLVLDERAQVDRFDGTGLPPVDAGARELPTPLGTMVDRIGSPRATVEGRAIAVQPPSGLVMRCPSCRRLLKGGACRLHGPVQGTPDLRLRLVLDDGTGAITLNLERADVERLTARSLAECLAGLSAHPDPSSVESELFGRLFGRRLRARGPVDADDFGLSMYPTEVGPIEVDPLALEDEIREKLGGRSR